MRLASLMIISLFVTSCAMFNKYDKKKHLKIAWKHEHDTRQGPVQGYRIYHGTKSKTSDSCINGVESPIDIALNNKGEDQELFYLVNKKDINSDVCYFSITSYNSFGESKSKPEIKYIVPPKATLKK